MNEEKMESIIRGLGEKLDEKKLASLVSYFSITQGRGSRNIPDLILFDYGDEPRFINWMRMSLNFFGLSVSTYNEGAKLLSEANKFASTHDQDSLFEDIKCIDPYKRWPFLKEEKFKVHIQYNEGITCCKFDSNGVVPSPMEEREVFINLYSLAKYSKVILESLKYDEYFFDEVFDVVVRLAFLHEKAHLEQEKFHKMINEVLDFRRSHRGPINDATALDILNIYLTFEYDAWERVLRETEGFHVKEMIGKKIYSLSLASIVTGWLHELYINERVLVYPEENIFKVDSNFGHNRSLL